MKNRRPIGSAREDWILDLWRGREESSCGARRSRRYERLWHLLVGHLADPPQRNIPTFRIKPRMYLLGAGVIMAYGWYKLVIGIREAKYVPPLSYNTTGLTLRASAQPRPEHRTPDRQEQQLTRCTASMPARRTGRGSTSSPSSRPRRTATRCAGTSRTRSGRRSSWART